MKRRLLIPLLAVLLLGGTLFFFYRYHGAEKQLHEKHCVSFSPRVSDEDGRRIQTLISTIAHTSTVSLLFKKGSLQKLGALLDQNVPPFVFLAYIFSHEELAKDMRLIQQSSMKYNNFLEGLQKNLLKEYAAGCFYSTAKGFAAHLGRDYNAMHPLLKRAIEEAEARRNKKAFRAFVDYLIKTS
jgi:hypothetical protein